MVNASSKLGFMISFKVKTTNNIFLLPSLTFTSFVTSLDFVAGKPKLA